MDVAAVAQDGDAVGDGKDLWEMMRDVDRGQTGLLEAAQIVEQPFGLGGGQRRRWFVEHQDARSEGNRLEDLDQLLQRRGQLFYWLIGVTRSS